MPKLLQWPRRSGLDFHRQKKQIEELSGVRQGPQDFVSRITQASNRLIGDTEAGQLIIKQLDFENTNAVCKAL